jgi:hypothetical protein
MALPDLSRVVRLIRSAVVAGVHPPAEFAGKKVSLTSVGGTLIDVDGTAGGDSLLVSLQLPGRVMTARADTDVITTQNVVVYPIDNFNVDYFLG